MRFSALFGVILASALVAAPASAEAQLAADSRQRGSAGGGFGVLSTGDSTGSGVVGMVTITVVDPSGTPVRISAVGDAEGFKVDDEWATVVIVGGRVTGRKSSRFQPYGQAGIAFLRFGGFTDVEPIFTGGVEFVAAPRLKLVGEYLLFRFGPAARIFGGVAVPIGGR